MVAKMVARIEADTFFCAKCSLPLEAQENKRRIYLNVQPHYKCLYDGHFDSLELEVLRPTDPQAVRLQTIYITS